MSKENMQRPIKFRAWFKSDKEMSFPADLYEIFMDRGFTDFSIDHPNNGQKEVVVMQFTGLLDKNGKEIYEGDICLYDGLPGAKGGLPIVWSKGGFFLQGRMGTDTKMLSQTTPSRDFEVIGNIYEHAHLLKGESGKV